MIQSVHRIAAAVAATCIGTFLLSTIVVELLGDLSRVASLKSLIVTPGLFVLVPAIALCGITGRLMASSRTGSLLEAKKQRMPVIALNGVFILVPAALYLDYLAARDSFGWLFFLTQGVELAAGFTNLTLVLMNVRDGMRLSGRSRGSTGATASPAVAGAVSRKPNG